MADKNDDKTSNEETDIDDEELELDVSKPKGNKMVMILLIVLIVLVLIIGGLGAWIFMSSDEKSTAVKKGDETSKSKDAGEVTEEAEKPKEPEVVENLEPLTYLSLTPEFVVNFAPGSNVRYLQIDLQVATRDKAALETLRTYNPVVRNDILVVISGQTYDDLKTIKGKEALQKKLLNAINNVINNANSGNNEGSGDETASEESPSEQTADTEHATEDDVSGPIENVYFLSFIMQ